jgi:hypothetical protein
MSAKAASISRMWTVGDRFRVTLTLPTPEGGAVVCASCEWDPFMPERLSAREMADYRRGRDAAMADLVQALKDGGAPC